MDINNFKRYFAFVTASPSLRGHRRVLKSVLSLIHSVHYFIELIYQFYIKNAIV